MLKKLKDSIIPPAPPPPPPASRLKQLGPSASIPSSFYPPESIQSHTSSGSGSPAYVIHTSYDPASPPALPSPDSSAWTRFVCISDTHTKTFKVPDGDVLLHSGDLTGTGRVKEMEITGEWLIGMKHPVKIVIAGNHDLPLHQEWYELPYVHSRFHRNSKESSSEVQDILTNERARESGIVYLCDSSHTFRAKETGKEWTVYGSPWQPHFGGWAFNYQPGDEAKARVAAIPETDILLTHGPPHNILDQTMFEDHAGCPSLLAHLRQMTNPPLLHVFGHIHEARGALVHSWSQGGKDTIMVNAANQPTGKNGCWMPDGHRTPFGGPGFQPIIVDVWDKA